jgi:hypothetical protein
VPAVVPSLGDARHGRLRGVVLERGGLAHDNGEGRVVRLVLEDGELTLELFDRDCRLSSCACTANTSSTDDAFVMMVRYCWRLASRAVIRDCRST